MRLFQKIGIVRQVRDMMVLIDYMMAKECKNIEERYSEICYKCGRCGRVFDEDGVMIDGGGTHPIEMEEE